MPSTSSALMTMQLEDFGALQMRYQSIQLARRAAVILEDAGAALQSADKILTLLSTNVHSKQAFQNLRKNSMLIGRMRPSEAKDTLMDAGNDFVEDTRRKLAAWRKTIKRISEGEGIVTIKNKECIAHDAPVAIAIAGSAQVSNHLSIVQLALAELAKIDSQNATRYASMVAEIRRSSTMLSDCETASGITTLVN